MLIWGSKGRNKKLGEGSFFCPHCRTNTVYYHYQTGRYFTLYFIPLFKTKTLGEYIECQRCHSGYETSILERKFDNTALEALQSIRSSLSKGIPVQKYIGMMVANDIEKSNAENWVMLATGGKFSKCKKCNLLYSTEVSICPDCGSVLEQPG
jgi:hypothetical protein